MVAKVDNELMAKLEKSGSDSEIRHFTHTFLYFWGSNFLAKFCFKYTFC